MIETKHLLLTKPTLSEVSDHYAYLGDPDAMKFTSHDPNIQACRRRIATHESLRQRSGYAPWTVRRIGTDRVIGWGGLYDDPFDPGWGIELAYFLHPDVWGQGLGKELAQAAMTFARDSLDVGHVSAFAHVDNTASSHILTSCGFRKIRHFPDMERDLFRWIRPDTASLE